MRFASSVALGVAALDEDDMGGQSMSLYLGLNAWMHESGTGADDAVETLLAVRSAVLGVSCLDEKSEPWPLVLRDPVAAVSSLARYLFHLLERAAVSLGTSREDVAEEAIALLAG